MDIKPSDIYGAFCKMLGGEKSKSLSPTDLIIYLFQVAPLIYCLIGNCWIWLTPAATVWLLFLIIVFFLVSTVHHNMPDTRESANMRWLLRMVKLYILTLVGLVAVITFVHVHGSQIVERALEKKMMNDDFVFTMDVESGVRRLPSTEGAPFKEEKIVRDGRTLEQAVEELSGRGLTIAKLVRPDQKQATAPGPAPVTHVVCMLSGGSFREWCILSVCAVVGEVLGELIGLSAICMLCIALAGLVIWVVGPLLLRAMNPGPPPAADGPPSSTPK